MPIGAVDGSTTAYTDGTAPDGTSVQYEVTALNAGGASLPSNAITVTIPQTPPANLVASAASDSEIDLSWDNLSQTADMIKIYRSSDGTNFDEIDAIGASANQYQDFGAPDAPVIYYQVVAAHAAAESSPSNTASAEIADSLELLG